MTAVKHPSDIEGKDEEGAASIKCVVPGCSEKEEHIGGGVLLSEPVLSCRDQGVLL